MTHSEWLALLDVTLCDGSRVPTLDDYTEALQAIHDREAVRNPQPWLSKAHRDVAQFGTAGRPAARVTPPEETVYSPTVLDAFRRYLTDPNSTTDSFPVKPLPPPSRRLKSDGEVVVDALREVSRR